MKGMKRIAGAGLLAAGLVSLAGCKSLCGRASAKGDADCPDGVCAAGAAIQAAPKPARTAYAEIGTDALATLIASGANPVLLDARVGQWDDGRRLPGAKALAPDTDEAGALAVIGGKDVLVVAYCTNLKCPASKHLANRLLELGFKNVMKYPEGIDDWQQRGHDIVMVK